MTIHDCMIPTLTADGLSMAYLTLMNFADMDCTTDDLLASLTGKSVMTFEKLIELFGRHNIAVIYNDLYTPGSYLFEYTECFCRRQDRACITTRTATDYIKHGVYCVMNFTDKPAVIDLGLELKNI